MKFDHPTQWLTQAREARALEDGCAPWPSFWTVGETLAVALLLGDGQRLADLGYTDIEASERLRHDVGESSAYAARRRFYELRQQL